MYKHHIYIYIYIMIVNIFHRISKCMHVCICTHEITIIKCCGVINNRTCKASKSTTDLYSKQQPCAARTWISDYMFSILWDVIWYSCHRYAFYTHESWIICAKQHLMGDKFPSYVKTITEKYQVMSTTRHFWNTPFHEQLSPSCILFPRRLLLYTNLVNHLRLLVA